MRRRPGLVVSLALLSVLTACGSAEPDGTVPVDRAGAAQDDPGSGAEGDRLELMTPGGIAVIVREHLGPNAVRRFITFEPEPGSVAVMVRLRDGGRADNFGVTVYSPEHADGFGRAGKCPPKRAEVQFGVVRCRTLENGTTVMTSSVPEGFSDDNATGMVVFGSAVTPDAGAAMAMYESYDDAPAISVTDLDSLLTDARLRWLTEPALNEAGEGIDLVKHTG